jgi:hypothetical protein
MDIPIGWRLDDKCRYTCVCNHFRTENLEEISSHMSEFEGYCLRGLRCMNEDKFQCICGEEFLEKKNDRSTRWQAYEHVCEQIEGTIQKCINRFRNKCEKCNLQLDSPSALKLHLTTKSHLNFENKVDLHCRVCDIHYRGQKEMIAHLKTKKHSKRLELIYDLI